jgi:osmoprotectant transport system permease protein
LVRLPRRIPVLALVVATMMAPIAVAAAAAGPMVRIGSKPFTEGIVLGEVLAGVARHTGFVAEHRAALGGTQIVFAALERGEIDCYVEYSGTLDREILRGEPVRGPEDVAAALARRGLCRTAPLGFDNTYALGMQETVAARAGIESISDLAGHDRRPDRRGRLRRGDPRGDSPRRRRPPDAGRGARGGPGPAHPGGV